MSSNTSAVLEVVVENKNVSSIIKDNQGQYDPQNLGGSCESSIVQSPSLESFSTIQDIENLSELNMDENSDFCAKIDCPQKHLETLETYITFRITTKVARIEFIDNEYTVRRRYNDFIWLRQKLVESHPFCIVPPLPAKHTLMGQLDRYSKEFILCRMKALNVFMNRVIQHPILSCNEHLHAFLTSKGQDFTTHRKQKHVHIGEDKAKTMNAANPNTMSLKCRNIEFDKAKLYLTTLAEKISSFERISIRINKERMDHVTELNSYHPVFTTWATHDPQLSHMLQGIGHALERTSAGETALTFSYNNTINGPARDFLSYIEVVQDTLGKRDHYQYAYENSMDELNRRHSEKDKLAASAQAPQNAGFSLWKQPSSDEKLEKLGTYIPQLLKRVESNQDNLECANECMRSDWERWQNEKHQCLKKMLLDFVKKQIEYEQIQVNAWQQVVNDLSSQNIGIKRLPK